MAHVDNDAKCLLPGAERETVQAQRAAGLLHRHEGNVKDGDLTWRELVQRIGNDEFGERVSDDDADFILWELTAFPLADRAHVEEQIRDAFAGVGEVQ